MPEIDGVGDECGLFVAGEPLAELGGETGGNTGAEGATGGVVWAGVIGTLAESRGCNLGTLVQLY